MRAELPLLAGLRKSNALPPATERGKVKPLVNPASQRRASVQDFWKGSNLPSSSYLGVQCLVIAVFIDRTSLS